MVLPFDGNLKLVARPIDRLGRSVYLNGYSDREHATLLNHFLKPGMTYVDVGAHLGQFTLMAAQRVGPSGHVHAFEATSDTYDLLAQSIALNGFTWVKANHTALFDHPCVVRLNVCIRGKGEFNSVSKPLRPEDQVVGTEEVQAITLDDYCRQNQVEHVDLVKIDVNGPEREVIRGGREILGKPGKRMMVIEFLDLDPTPGHITTAGLRQEIESLGYQLFNFDPETIKLTPAPMKDDYRITENLVAIKER